MQLNLLEAKAANQPFAYEALNKFRELAKPFQITLGSAQSWPKIQKNRVIFGATMNEAVRGKHAREEPITDRMPLDMRVRGFLKKLAEELGQMMDDGHVVHVLTADRPSKSEYKLATKDNVFDLLKKYLSHSSFDSNVEPNGPTILWSVSTPEVSQADTMYRVILRLTYGNPRRYYKEVSHDMYVSVPKTDKTFADKFKQIQTAYMNMNGTHPSKRAGVEKAIAAGSDVILDIFRDIGIKLPSMPHDAAPFIFSIRPSKNSFYRRSAIELSQEVFTNDVMDAILANQNKWTPMGEK